MEQKTPREKKKERIANLNKAFGSALYKKRISAGGSRADLARATGISPSQLEKYEKCRNRMSFGTGVVIAEYLGVSFKEILSESRAFDEVDNDDQNLRSLLRAYSSMKDERMRHLAASLVRRVASYPDIDTPDHHQ